ncbi:hypothetical protein [Salinigranum marinum]|uniref:hypothetical protein n=1 Tax=Salinigranum marinum TaxID=1515595 RepID=UPI002989AB2E|nr:hypothetical protein [Salinigranum marinum]
MSGDRLDALGRETGAFVRFVLLWFGLDSAVAPVRTVVRVATGSRPEFWLVPVVAAVVTTAVYWSVDRLSWRLVGRAWALSIVVSVLSVVGFALVSLDDGSGLVAAATVGSWWAFSVAVGLGLTSPAVWRAFRDRLLLRPRS